MLAWCSLLNSLKFVMQHAWPHSEKVDLLTPRVRGGVCGQTICYQVAAFVIPFNLICNMTMF